MKSYRKELWFNIPARRGFVNITPDVETAIIPARMPSVENSVEVALFIMTSASF